jgi:hypothetical protein
MSTYLSPGHKSIAADSMQEAAQIFADRKARKIFGKSGYCRTCLLGSWSQNGEMGEFSAFIGYSTGANETAGINVNFSVFRE